MNKLYLLGFMLVLSGCLADSSKDEPVCEDVQKVDSYCYYPYPQNQDKYNSQCGFQSKSNCWDFADPDGNGLVNGTCEADYVWVRECN